MCVCTCIPYVCKRTWKAALLMPCLASVSRSESDTCEPAVCVRASVGHNFTCACVRCFVSEFMWGFAGG